MPKSALQSKRECAMTRILQANVKTQKTDIVIECRDGQDRLFATIMPRADRLGTERDIIRDEFAMRFNCASHRVLLDARPNRGTYWVEGPGFAGKATVSSADHDADKRRRGE